MTASNASKDESGHLSDEDAIAYILFNFCIGIGYAYLMFCKEYQTSSRIEIQTIANWSLFFPIPVLSIH